MLFDNGNYSTALSVDHYIQATGQGGPAPSVKRVDDWSLFRLYGADARSRLMPDADQSIRIEMIHDFFIPLLKLNAASYWLAAL
jgi:hypothetical protein